MNELNPENPGNRVVKVTLYVEVDTFRLRDDHDLEHAGLRELDAAVRRLAMEVLSESDMDDDGRLPVAAIRLA